MADSDEDDGYLDDELDALDHEALLQLEKRALQATEQQRPPPRDLSASHEHRRGPYVVAKAVKEFRDNSHYATNTLDELVDQPSSDYGDVDEVLDETLEESSTLAPPGQWHAQDDMLDIGESTQREQWRINRYGPNIVPLATTEEPSLVLPHRGPSSTLERHGNRALDNGLENHDDSSSRRALANDTITAESELPLQAELEKLRIEKKQWESERARLELAVKAAQDQVLGKTGEIAIIRSNYAKQDKNYDKLINELKCQQSEKDERHKAELETARKEREALITHSRFLDHEAVDEVWQTKHPKKLGKSKALESTSSPSKRHHNAPFGDGFDDEEILASSPSKPAPKTKPLTPKNGSKRKRDVLQDSPAPPLQFSQYTNTNLPHTIEPSAADAGTKQELDDGKKGKTRFEFLSKLLNHSRTEGERRTFEALATYYYPSKPDSALSTLFIDRLSPANVKQEGEDFPAAVGTIVLSLWSSCLTEQYYAPLNLLLDLLKFVLLNGDSGTAARLMDDIVNLAQVTADINVIPRFQTLNRKARLTNSFSNAESFPKPSGDVDSQQCLQILLLTASLVGYIPSLLASFWHRMRLDFVSIVLRVSQRVEDVILMMKLLETCAREDNFNEIASQSPDGQTAGEHIVDRLSSMLVEIPRPLEGEAAYDAVEICELRLHLLILIEKICDQTKGCGLTFALHSQAIGRLVRLMNDELNAIYSQSHEHTQELRSELVNRATRLLFWITTAYASEINLQEKLRTQPGGVHKFLITLSRLAFSDAVHYEKNIDEDVFDCAHVMLEDFVTPEEADSLKRAFLREE